MDMLATPMPEHHQVIMNRLLAACRSDERVVAAFLSGSYARNAADAHSDLDFGLVISVEAYDDFFARREVFVRRLGQPIFLEDYHGEGGDYVFSMFPDGTEVELGLGREHHFTHLYSGPYQVLLDKKGILTGAPLSSHKPSHPQQIETLHQLIYWFWHDLSHHFVTPLARGQLWSAYGALEDLRRTCVNLARLQHNFSMEAEGYERIEQALPIENIKPLQATLCPLEHDPMLQSALLIVRFYQELVPSLAQAHNIPYPADLARVMSRRLVQLCQSSGVNVPELIENTSD